MSEFEKLAIPVKKKKPKPKPRPKVDPKVKEERKLKRERKNSVKPAPISHYQATHLPPPPKKIREFQKPIDWEIVRDMVKVGCNIDECAGRFGVTRALMYERCIAEQQQYWKEFEQSAFMTTLHRLRDVQFKIAFGYNRTGPDGRVYNVAPDTQMAIHLGKQYLGQSEKLDVKNLFAGYIIENEDKEVIDGDYEDIPGVVDGVAIINLDDYENIDDEESN